MRTELVQIRQTLNQLRSILSRKMTEVEQAKAAHKLLLLYEEFDALEKGLDPPTVYHPRFDPQKGARLVDTLRHSLANPLPEEPGTSS